MSQKSERQDSITSTGSTTSSGSKVLRKALSFKDDIKSAISRRSSSFGRSSSPQGHKSPIKVSNKSPRHSKRKTVSRAGSFNETAKTDKLYQENDVDKLETESKKVFQALRYIQDVVDKNILQLLPGSATVVLETVMEVNQLLSNYFINQESTVLTSSHNQVYQSLANLIRWADELMINGDESLDKENASKIIKAVGDGLQELMKLSTEKLKTKNQQTYQTLPPKPKSPTPESEMSSLPDIPLTPREKKILEETSDLSQCNNNIDKATEDVVDGPPPTKPPLPPNWASKIPQPSGSSDVPPPLPAKQRLYSGAYDNASLESVGENTPANQIAHFTFGVTSSLVSPFTTTLSQSPTSSISSNFSQSSEDILDDAPSLSRQSGDVFSQGDMRFSQYDNFSVRTFSSANSHQFTNLTDQINKLTSSIDAQGVLRNNSPPPLPDKQKSAESRIRVFSQYDNVSPPPTARTESTTLAMTGSTITSAAGVHMTGSSLKSSTGVQMTGSSLTSATGVQMTGSSLTSATGVQMTGSSLNSATGVQMTGSSLNSATGVQMTGSSLSSATGVQMTGSSLSSATGVQMTGGSLSSATGVQSMLAARSSGAIAAGMRSSTGAVAITTASGFRATATSTMYTKSMHVTLSRETFSSTETFHSNSSSADSLQNPPPLPLKKKHVEAYMQMFGESARPSVSEYSRRSIHSVNYYQSQWFQHQREIFHPLYPRSNTLSGISDISSNRTTAVSMLSEMSDLPGLNPDMFSLASSSSSGEDSLLAILPPELPPKRRTTSNSSAGCRNSDSMLPSLTGGDVAVLGDSPTSSTLDAKIEGEKRLSAPLAITSSSSSKSDSPSPDSLKDGDSAFDEICTLDDVDVRDQLLKKKPGDDGPEIRGGSLDALIVHATYTGKHDFMYQEAFLTTYRTFITPIELIKKLRYRYNGFSRMNDVKKKKLSRNAFSLIIRVVDELCAEVDERIIQILMDLVFQLLCDGELMLARILRRKALEKCEQQKKMSNNNKQNMLLTNYHLTAKPYSLLEFKAENIAEQMTLLDAELFQRIEIPEVLLWAKEQNEEQSPNLTEFTEHFNKMSYWCRTRILEQEDPKDREKFLMKFIKIMKYLRKFSNFNSYLAILSALDSAPIRRLEWQRQNLEALKEFCLLIDSSSSFRAYRHALAETEPPCIPYIGLVLQDLTFVHIGNPDIFPDGNLNFAKRWQQFNILDNMKRFKKCVYDFKKNQKITSYFNNFDDYLCEESLWCISETIRPRGGKKKPE